MCLPARSRQGAQNRVQTLPDPVGPPTRCRLERSPFGALEDSPGRFGEEQIRSRVDLVTYRVDLCGQIGLVAGHVFGNGLTVHLASRLAQLFRQTLSVLKDSVRNRNGGLHTPSITPKNPVG